MHIIVRYMPQFVDDFNSFPEQKRIIIRSAIQKLNTNPYPKKNGGYGNVVFKASDGKILNAKILFTDIRIVYKIMKSKNNSTLVIYTAVTNDAVNPK